MKINLPLENWTDFFKLVPRQQLIQLFPQIDDRQFASFLQYYLKKFDELDKLHITTNWTVPIIVKTNGEWELPLADLPMPLHIKNFQEIQISYFDGSVLNFLKEFHRNSLFTNVNLKMSTKEITSPENRLEFLTRFVPLMTSINSIELLFPSLYPGLFQNEYSKLNLNLFKGKGAKISLLQHMKRIPICNSICFHWKLNPGHFSMLYSNGFSPKLASNDTFRVMKVGTR